MATGFSIASVANKLDGRKMRVSLSGLPSGSVTFLVSRTPDRSGAFAPVAATSIDARTFDITVTRVALWYVWAIDTNGPVDVPGAAWVGFSDIPALDNVGIKLAQIMTDNIPGINAALQTWFPGTTVKQVVYGSALDIRDFPAIAITKPSVQDEYTGIPFLRTLTFSLEIHLYTLHQDKGSWTQAAARFTGRVMEILNQPDYSAILLPDQILSMCHAFSGNVDEIEVEPGAFATVGTTIWTGIGDQMDLPSNFG